MELREIRKNKGLTQRQAAVIAGVSLESYKNHELGRSKPDTPIGRMIIEKIETYLPYDFSRGIMPISAIKDGICKVFQEKEIDFAYLFGSYAKGEARESSDIDILLAGSITGLDFFSLAGELERALHKKVDILRLDDILTNKDLLKEILKTGMLIYVKNEG